MEVKGVEAVEDREEPRPAAVDDAASDPDGEAAEAELPLDQVFEILRNQRRRYVLEFLDEIDGEITMGQLSERIAALENGKEVHEISSRERKRVYVGLYQCHLPKMDGMDVISFNKPRGIIEPGPNADLFDRYLVDDVGDRARWHAYYAGLSMLAAAVILAALALRGLTAFPVLEVAVLGVVVTFLAVSGANVWRTRRDTADA